ncbi:2-hydroxyacid dehydrogenase [Candidimonas humi]|uniref:2-hydroxyacid dehydrogenase n=1 Tax=Candidimonas humi TaxID=683355 RepID=A0ABV8P0M3_9BURK|nr:2-hydroxyacid dehydrogenase [Candidimonas humi]MBV6306894.1 2-hydroxyacid dehydrogenase [Candidimonas humi]
MPTTPATARRLLQIGPLPAGLETALQQRYQVHPLWQEPDRSAFLARTAGSFDGAVTMSRHGCTADIFESLGKGVVACFGVGFEGLDLQAAARHGVQVSTTPDVLNDCVADCAFGLILASARGLVAADRHVQQGRWPAGPFPLATRVSGKHLGIVGLGRIGAAIARRASGFDMPVRYHGRKPQPEAPYGYEPGLIELARWADFLVVACRGGAETRHLINAPVLRALGPQGFLINIARGSVVDEQALAQAIAQEQIGGAGLDVYEHEPQVHEGLLGRDNVVVLPHVAATTRETRNAMEQLVLDNLQAYFATGKVLTPPA